MRVSMPWATYVSHLLFAGAAGATVVLVTVLVLLYLTKRRRG